MPSSTSSIDGRGKRCASKPPAATNDVAPDGAEPGPERRRGAGRAGVDVMVQEVAKARDELWGGRVLVVGAEDRVQPRIGVEALAQQAQRVRVDLDVGIDEDDDLALRARDPGVARGGGPAAAADR